MIQTTHSVAPGLWATGPAPDPAPLVEEVATLRLENAALRAENAAFQEQVRQLEARLGQNSSNSSRPPSSDPPQAPAARRRRPLDASAVANPDTVGRAGRWCRSRK
jgi:hypothetical protein